MKVWKGLIWPFLSKMLKFMLSLFERTATELAKKIPEALIDPISEKIKELANDPALSGEEKMKRLKEYAVALLGSAFSAIGDSALETFLQVLYQDLKDKGVVK